MNSLGGETRHQKTHHLEYLERCIEMSMVNGERREDSMPTSFRAAHFESLSPEELQHTLHQKFQQKEAKSNYNYTIMKFISHLIKISLHLFGVAKEQRGQVL